MNEDSFEVLFRENFEVLRNIAFRVVKDTDIAKDIVQQVFYKLWKNKDQLNIKSSMRSYLHRAVINTSLNHIEKNKKMIHVEDEQLANTKSNIVDAVEQLSHDDMQGALKKAIDVLPERCRLVFVLSRFDGLSNKEIASHMDTTLKTVENQMGKALKHLREHLRPLLENKLISISSILFFNLAYSWVLISVYLS